MQGSEGKAPGMPAGSRSRRLSRLRRAALIEVEDVVHLYDRPFSREIAVAYFDGRPTVSWLVLPEAAWPQGSGQGGGAETPPGARLPAAHGMAPGAVAVELLAAVEGRTVYASLHWAVARWLGRLFAAAGRDLPFQVRDAAILIRRHSLSKEQLREADAMASALYAKSVRAAREATCLAAFVLAVNGGRPEGLQGDTPLGRRTAGRQA